MQSFELVAAQLAGDCNGTAALTVLYDEGCPLCRRMRAWLAGQATLVPLQLLAAGSPCARARYPQLDHQRTKRVLTVVTAGGAVYEGERAWLVCAWALPRWQPIAELMGTRPRLLVVRTAARAVDRHRLRGRDKRYGANCETCRVTAPTAR